jgi:hypothetical protein
VPDPFGQMSAPSGPLLLGRSDRIDTNNRRNTPYSKTAVNGFAQEASKYAHRCSCAFFVSVAVRAQFPGRHADYSGKVPLQRDA